MLALPVGLPLTYDSSLFKSQPLLTTNGNFLGVWILSHVAAPGLGFTTMLIKIVKLNQ